MILFTPYLLAVCASWITANIACVLTDLGSVCQLPSSSHTFAVEGGRWISAPVIQKNRNADLYICKDASYFPQSLLICFTPILILENVWKKKRFLVSSQEEEISLQCSEKSRVHSHCEDWNWLTSQLYSHISRSWICDSPKSRMQPWSCSRAFK